MRRIVKVMPQDQLLVMLYHNMLLTTLILQPSARSEFSHPDTAITLTCLSYYYGGLNDEQIRASFEELFQSDHAQEDYVLWTQSCEEMPKAFKQLSGVNLRDRQQCSLELFPSIRYSKGLIDYYLQHLVFPKEMKEFSNKLSSSGWVNLLHLV